MKYEFSFILKLGYNNCHGTTLICSLLPNWATVYKFINDTLIMYSLTEAMHKHMGENNRSTSQLV